MQSLAEQHNYNFIMLINMLLFLTGLICSLISKYSIANRIFVCLFYYFSCRLVNEFVAWFYVHYILILDFEGGSFANITPVQTEVYETEGENVTLSCNYSSALTLQWYRQYPGSAPEFLLVIIQSTGKVSQKSDIVDRDPRFFGKVNEKKTHVHLEISSAKVTDSAMYYCALQPTVTGNTRTLYKNPLNSNTVLVNVAYSTMHCISS